MSILPQIEINQNYQISSSVRLNESAVIDQYAAFVCAFADGVMAMASTMSSPMTATFRTLKILQAVRITAMPRIRRTLEQGRGGAVDKQPQPEWVQSSGRVSKT